MHLLKSISGLMAAVAALGWTASAVASPLPTYNLVLGNGGDATAYFVGFEAGDTDVLSLATTAGTIFTNQTTPIGTTYNLGTFAAGSEIEFKLTDNSVPATFYTGPGSRNPDGNVHADVTNLPTDIPGYAGLSATSQAYGLSLEASDPNVIFVGFEDRVGDQSDFDYNDLVFAVNNGSPATTLPEPSTLALLGVAFLGIFAFRRRWI